MNGIPNEPTPFEIDWPEPSPLYLGAALPHAPRLPLAEVFGEALGRWIAESAESKSAPVDYVAIALLAVAGSLLGNTRWVAPWEGWAEPPILWAAAIGSPSSGKSPALDAVLSPLRTVEKRLQLDAEKEIAEWSEKAAIAALAESTWKEQVKAAFKTGESAPERPKEADPGPKPHKPRLVVADATVERLAHLAGDQVRGPLLARDELAGWLQSMTRYSSGTDRPFWLEAYGGRRYAVERMGRDPVSVDRLAIGVLGTIQPDKLKSLLLSSDDDGLLARLLPIYPDPIPLKRPSAVPDKDLIERIYSKLIALKVREELGEEPRPWFHSFEERARVRMDAFRLEVRVYEDNCDGLLLSFVGKAPGMAARIALILSYLDWAAGSDLEPTETTEEVFERAACLVTSYLFPMASRAYADASLSKTDRLALKLVALIREKGWERFTLRDVRRLQRSGLDSRKALSPVLAALEREDVLRVVPSPAGLTGGRPTEVYVVNPAVLKDG